MINKVRAWEAKIVRLTFRPRFKPDETWIGYQRRTAVVTEKLKEEGLAAVDQENCEQHLDHYDVGCP